MSNNDRSTHPPNQDLPRAWVNLARRLYKECHRHNPGLILLDVKVLVGPNGVPELWTSPKKTFIEPRKEAERLLDLLTQ